MPELVGGLIHLKVGPDEKDNSDFGVLMRMIRDEADLSRTVAAMLVGISPEYLRLIENGERVPAAGTARIMLHEYGVPYEITIEDGKHTIIFRDRFVEFTSRIQEARQRKDQGGYDQTRDALIGRIVRLLDTVDDKVLDRVLETLLP
jgi:transcriptional regulator with XRE-family HTH domain